MKECNQCGKCCIKYSDGGLSVSALEIEFWEEYRPEITEFVLNGKIWFDKVSGKPLKLCPWLKKIPGQEKYACDIYYDRPDDCKYYPVTIDQMINDACEMLDSRDLAKPKLAQRTLNRIMADSRPPYK